MLCSIITFNSKKINIIIVIIDIVDVMGKLFIHDRDTIKKYSVNDPKINFSVIFPFKNY